MSIKLKLSGIYMYVYIYNIYYTYIEFLFSN